MSRKNIIVAITTFDADALRISLPPLERFGHSVTLVIHNDNPEFNLTPRMVRQIGWRGRTYIINADKNYGELESRIWITEFIRANSISGDWIVFVADDDVLLDACLPNVPDDVFAVLYNATTISDKITDLFKISSSWTDGTVYGKTGPHFDILGTVVRTNIMMEYCDFLRAHLDAIYEFTNSVKYYPPFSAMMWAGLNVYMRICHSNMSPIYTDKTNYVSIKLGRGAMKYGRRAVYGAVARGAVRKFADIIQNLLVQNMVA